MNMRVHTAPARASQSPITRRQALRSIAAGAALGASAACAAVVVSGAEAAPIQPDAELLALAAPFDHAFSQWSEVSAGEIDDDEANRRCMRLSALSRQIAAQKATTFEGLALKVRAMAAQVSDFNGWGKLRGIDEYPTGNTVMLSALRDAGRGDWIAA